MNSSLAEILAALLLSSGERAREAASQIGERGHWTSAIRLAMMWRSLPQLRRQVAELEIALAPEASKSLSSFSAASAVESAMICRGAARAFAALEKAGVNAACFKGLGTIALIYRDPSRRMLNDADILLRQSDFPAASIALREAGFSPAIDMEFDDWLELLAQRVYPAHDFLDFVDEDGVRIDLHWQFRFAGRGYRVDDILGRSVDASVAGKRIRRVSPEDLLVLTANHLIRDQLAPFSAVKDLVDIRLLTESASNGQLDIALLAKRALDAGAETSLLTAIRILADCSTVEGVADLDAQLTGRFDTRANVAATRLSELFSHQLRVGSTNSIVIGMAGATPALAGRFIASRIRMLTDSAYRAHKFPGSNRRGAGQLARTFLRDIVTLTPARFRQYRTLAAENRRQLKPEP